MKMKQISDTTLKITMSLEDLMDRGMEIADFLVIQPQGKIHLQPQENMLSHLVYAVKSSDVDDVYIAGEQVVRAGKVLTVSL